jgi:hypothetical protein
MTNKEEWKDEFREYFDKTLKPKKPTIKNLDRELCVDFISKQIEQAREVVRVVWEDSKDELYTYFGKCECGETCIIVGSKYCHSCGNIISNPLRSND